MSRTCRRAHSAASSLSCVQQLQCKMVTSVDKRIPAIYFDEPQLPVMPVLRFHVIAIANRRFFWRHHVRPAVRELLYTWFPQPSPGVYHLSSTWYMTRIVLLTTVMLQYVSLAYSVFFPFNCLHAHPWVVLTSLLSASAMPCSRAQKHP